MIILNGMHHITPTMFPDNTSQVWKIPKESFRAYRELEHTITWKFEHEGELMWVGQLVDLIRNHSDRFSPKINLEIPYLPYARQDKDISNEATFALHTFAKLINAMGFAKVVSRDVHSSHAFRLIHNLWNVHPYNQISDAVIKTGATTLVYPDHGAWERYGSNFNTLGKLVLIGHKVRNQNTGQIEFIILNKHPKSAKEYVVSGPVLIIDDICDGGATFIKLIPELLDHCANPEEIHLFTTHGIYSKGLRHLRVNGITRIFNYDGEVHESTIENRCV